MFGKRNPGRMRYLADSWPARLCYFSILACIAYFVALYSNASVVPEIRLGADVIINIVFMLIVFWASEMVKVYDRKWALALGGLGVVQVARVFWIPFHYRELEMLTDGAFTFLCIALAFSGVLLFLACAVSYSNSTLLKKYLEKTSGEKYGQP